MQITINLSDAQVKNIQDSLPESRFDDVQKIAESLIPLTISSWIDWLSGAKRYNSLTEQYLDWIEEIYSNILSLDEAPSTDRLFSSFNIPYGQAQYIARVLNNKQLTLWRKKAVENLKSLFDKRKKEIFEWIQAGDGDRSADFLMDSVTFIEFKLLVEHIHRKTPDQIQLYRHTSEGNLYNVLIPAFTFQKLCEVLAIN
jgi:hypothetical protein